MTVYIYRFKNNPKRKQLYGRKCVVLARMKKNSCVIEMCDDKSREVVSRNAIRKVEG